MGQNAKSSNVVRMDDHRPVATAPALVDDIKLSSAFLRGVLLWACNDETRFHMSGVHFSGRDVVATDGHRLIKATVIPIASGAAPAAAWAIEQGVRRYTIPRGPLELACKAAGPGGSVTVRLATTRQTTGAGSLASADPRPHGVLIATRKQTRSNPTPGEVVIPWSDDGGKFPPYDQVVPTHTTLMECNDDKAIKGAKKSGEVMSTDEYLTSRDISGHGVNPRYLGDMADVIDGFEARNGVALVHCGGRLDPIVYNAIVRDERSERYLITFVIMPMRV